MDLWFCDVAVASGRPEVMPGRALAPFQEITPVEYEGVKVVSFGFAGQGSAIMRGAMVSGGGCVYACQGVGWRMCLRVLWHRVGVCLRVPWRRVGMVSGGCLRDEQCVLALVVCSVKAAFFGSAAVPGCPSVLVSISERD
jgi:hypothetical protein